MKAQLQQYRRVDLHINQGEYSTVSDLQTAVEGWYGVSYKDKIRDHALLHESGLSFQRSVKVYRS